MEIAVALVIASNASKSDNMNDGYQMITEGVKDALEERFVCPLEGRYRPTRARSL